MRGYQINPQLTPSRALRYAGLGDALAIPPSLQNIGSPYQQLTGAQLADLQSWAAGQLPGGVSDAVGFVGQYASLGVSAFNSLMTLAKSSSPQQAIGSVTPLIAAGLAALGASPVIGIAVLAGLSVLSGLLGSAPSVPSCTVALPQCPSSAPGNLPCGALVCMNVSQRPAGPQDPTWLTIDRFDWNKTTSAGTDSQYPFTWSIYQTPGGSSSFSGVWWAGLAFSNWWYRIGLELYALGDRSVAATDWADMQNRGAFGTAGTADALAQSLYLTPNATRLAALGPAGRDFIIAFDKAFIKLYAEPLINGYPPMPTDKIVSTIVGAWNLGRSNSATQQFNPPTTPSISGQWSAGVLGPQALFIEQFLLAGYLDGQRQYPGPTVNLGSVLDTSTAASNSGGSGSGAGSSVVPVLAATVAAGAAGVVAYHYLTGVAVGQVGKRAWGALTGLLK